MKNLQHLLLTAAMLVVSLIAQAQANMTIELKNGSILSFYISEISKISWNNGTNNPGGVVNDPDLQSVTGDAIEVTSYSANITCYANNILDNLATDLKVGVIYTDKETLWKNDGKQVTVSKSSIGSDGKYTVLLNNLKENTTYQYRSFVYQSGIYFLGEVKSFTTKPQQAAVTFYTGSATDITCYSAKVSAQMLVDPSSDYSRLSYGICYGTTAEPTTKLQVTSKDASGAYSITLTRLTGNTIYYYRPYADMDGIIHFGPVSSFKTSEDNVVETGEADDEGRVKSKLTIGGGAYKSLSLGLCWSTTNETPTVNDNYLITSVVDDDNSYTLTIPLTATATYYYRSYVLVDGVAHYGAVGKLAYTLTYKAVDLGLSVKWATRNVSAKPEGYYYFAWGSTYYDLFDYEYGEYGNLTKYTTADGKTVLDPEDDVAHVKWGGTWRMPTKAEMDELLTKCTWKWTSQNGADGYLVTGTNGNSIFLPDYGYFAGRTLEYGGLYWSSSLYENDTNYAYCIHFDSERTNMSDHCARKCGGTVRPVCP